MERRNTIYDGVQVDWDAFVQEQADFYRNARQYMTNLQIDIERLDQEIEDMLMRCEEESCNVAQGYKLFKKLKDLRIEKREKLDQLQKVSVIAERLDVDVMREIFEEIEDEYGLDQEDLSDNVQPVQETVSCETEKQDSGAVCTHNSIREESASLQEAGTQEVAEAV